MNEMLKNEETYFILKMKFRSGGFEGEVNNLGLYLLRGQELKEIWFEKEIRNNQRHWTSTLRDICKIQSEANILDEFFEKSSHSINISLKEFYNFEKISFAAGSYFPRIYRPIIAFDSSNFYQTPDSRINRLQDELNQVNDYLPRENETVLTGVTQLSSLIESLKIICRTIYPKSANLNVYGNDIRNLLILSCTEVEAQLRGIYEANCHQSPLKNTKTADYFKLCDSLKLKEYKIGYCLFPWLPYLSPFSEWASDFPTQSLPWYDSYNFVKHDRERNFDKASLIQLLNSVAAIAILLKAQVWPSYTFLARAHWPVLFFYANTSVGLERTLSPSDKRKRLAY